jgi:hypothetical protein
MGKFSGAWARPVQGVSQQPTEARKDGQCTAQINMVPDVVEGLKDRMGTESIIKLMESLHEDSLIYHYDRGDEEEYFIFIEPNSDPVLVTIAGVSCNLTVTSTHTAYWRVTKPKDTLRLITIADYTFILNTAMPVEATADTMPAKKYEAMVYCQFANYGRTYQILLNDTVVAQYATPDGSVSSHILDIATSNIIAELKSDLDNYSATYNSTVVGNSIHIERVDGSYFKCATADDANGEDLVCITDHVTSTAKLPAKAVDDFVVEVKAESKDAPSFWLKAIVGSNDNAIWRETVEPGLLYKFDRSTMPQTLIRTDIIAGIPQFSLEEGAWEDRLIGDNLTNPFPSFINHDTPVPLDTIGVFQNRMLFTSQGSCVAGRSGEFFNFWKESTQTSSDADPFDVYSDSNKVQDLAYANTHEGDLVCFSQEAQFVMKGDKPVTKKNATLQKVTDYENISGVDPKSSGSALFFPIDVGGYTGIREFFTDTITDVKEARLITEHVPKYLEGKATFLAASTNKDWLLVFTDEAKNVIYVYNWLWIAQEKVQSAWHKWTLPEGEEFLFAQFTSTSLYFIIKRVDGIYLERMVLSDPVGTGLEEPVRLDRRTVVTATPSGELYEMDDPYPTVDLDTLVCVRSTGAYESELGSAIVVHRDGGKLKTYEDLQGASVSVIIGTRFDMTYEPTEPVIRDGKDRAIRVDDLIVGECLVAFTQSAGFDTTVNYKDGDPIEYEFDGRIMGSSTNFIGTQPLADGDYLVPIMAVSTDYSMVISKNSHRPLRIQNLEWSGQFTQRSRRV